MSDANNILLFFIFQGHDIRVVIHDSEPWFVAKDVCEVLEISNVSQAINGNTVRNETGLDEDEKGIYQVYTSEGPRATLCINKPGLYHLISKSRMPGAKTFVH
jgi:prophage antirepressor-like protein